MRTFWVFVVVALCAAAYWFWPWGRPPLDYLLSSKEEKTFLVQLKMLLEDEGRIEMPLGDMTDFEWERVCWWSNGVSVDGPDPTWALGTNAFMLSRTVYAREGFTTLVFQKQDLSYLPMYINRHAYKLEGDAILKSPKSGTRQPCFEQRDNPVLQVRQVPIPIVKTYD